VTDTFFHDVFVVAMDDEHGSAPFRADVHVSGDLIAAVGPGLPVPAGATVVEGRDRLLMPGLVNAHVHSWEAMVRGR